MPVVLLFAQAREAAGSGSLRVEAATVDGIVAELTGRFGPAMAEIIAASQVFVDGEPAERDQSVGEDDEVAIVPPVSGG